MSDFKAKMHQIRFWLGLCPRPRWGSLQRFPDPLAAFKGPTSKRREERVRKGGEGGEEKGEREGKEGIRKKERGGRRKGKTGEGKGQGREGKFRGQGKGKARSKEKGRRGKISGQASQMFFPRTAPGMVATMRYSSI